MRRIVSLAVLATLLLMLPARTLARQSTGFTDDEAVKIARALAELEQRRAEVAALKDAAKADARHVAALESALTACERAAAEWQKAAEARAVANDADARLEASYQESVKRYQEELARVREERDDARRSKWLWAVGGALIGAVLVVAAGRD